ncbi:hypothetical protein GCM10007276_14690 [Agaricicola taiwanensis]|uniref:DUF2946 domain-containing protein n=1 Tax=Agaricicola taiwanensis TaxID=591372 RepID=A0A8J2VUB3_9RHOB|nr:hypothetical protein GCM10007276_14690 [Agaricicola taiwanensis]
MIRARPPVLLMLRRSLAVALTYVVLLQTVLTGLVGAAHAAGHIGGSHVPLALCSGASAAPLDEPAHGGADCPCGAMCATLAGTIPPPPATFLAVEHSPRLIGVNVAAYQGRGPSRQRSVTPFAPRAPPAGSTGT